MWLMFMVASLLSIVPSTSETKTYSKQKPQFIKKTKPNMEIMEL